MLISDAQVHAPDVSGPSPVRGIGFDELCDEMDRASIDRAVIVPLGDDIDPRRALEYVRRAPNRFAVMGRPPLGDPELGVRALEDWSMLSGLVGIRVSFANDRDRPYLVDGHLEWMWDEAERHGYPVMINAPRVLDHVATLARRRPGLQLTIDHMGLVPFKIYSGTDELLAEVDSLLGLASLENVSVKASALPASVDESYPFPSLHEPIRRVVQEFGARRVFWGSDLTRLPCTYSECSRLVMDALEFLSEEECEWIMGRGISEWLRWTAR
jgi:L-fuconolactonase